MPTDGKEEEPGELKERGGPENSEVGISNLAPDRLADASKNTFPHEAGEARGKACSLGRRISVQAPR